MHMKAAFLRWRYLRPLLIAMLIIIVIQAMAFAQLPEDVDAMPTTEGTASLPEDDAPVPGEREPEAEQQPEEPATTVSIDSIAVIKEQDRIGLRIISEQPIPYRVGMYASSTRLVVDIPESSYQSGLPQSIDVGADVVLRSLQTQPLGEVGTQVTLTLAYGVPKWSDTGWVRIEGGLYKLVIAAQRQFVWQQEYTIQPGLTLIMHNRADLTGPISVRALRFSPYDPQVRFGVGLAKGVSIGLETVQAIARRHGAYAGINATYFHTTGLALGLLVDNYAMISTPVYDRTALLMLSDGSIGMDRAALQAYVNLAEEKKVAIHGFNRVRKAGEVVVYNSAFGTSTPKDSQVRELVIEQGVVVAIGRGNTPIAPGTTVIAHDSQSVLVLVQAGEPAYVTWDLRLLGYKQMIPGYLVRFAVSGGPRLVTDGQVNINSVEEQFRSDVTQGRAPRTAIGITADNQILLVTVDGRQNNYSMGMTLEQLAQLMIDLGAVQAMNLDGGGSTTMVVDDMLVNRPSDGSQRAVSSALLVYTRGGAPSLDVSTFELEHSF
jgi:hypothetical protein